MPKIQWERLPREKWAHLRDRAKERQISEEDLFELAEWKAKDPDVPDGDWFKDFGTSSCAAMVDIQVHFCWPDKPHGVSGCDGWVRSLAWV